MKRTLTLLLLLSALGASLPASLLAQGGTPYERHAFMDGNLVRTVFGNWGVIGQPSQFGQRGSWKTPNNGYLGDVSPFVGAEVKWNGLTFHSVVTCPVQRPAATFDRDPITSEYWAFEPLAGYFSAGAGSVAMSNYTATWPPYWPDKLSDLVDPGWRGSWNGYFGKRISSDLETYFVMDDNADKHFNLGRNNSFNISFKPDSTNPNRNGLGLVMSVRAMQWAQFLAKDNIFWLYEITNTGTTNYDRAVFGMLVGTYLGVTSTEDYGEYRDDWSFYDANENITFTGDFGRIITNPLWVGPVGMVGYAFLESPGNPFDGVDNDGDADSSAVGIGAPKFVQTSFDSVTIKAGQQIVLIDEDYTRHTYTVPNVDSVFVTTRGLSMWIKPGKTRLAEGNEIQQILPGGTYVYVINPNVYDGVDNNFNGLIDENYYIHYRQIKRQPDPTLPPLINQLRPVRYVDYRSGAGTSPLSMIDERRNDLVDNNGNWNIAFDDLGRDGIVATGDYGEGDGQPTSGYDAQFNDTGLPGEPRIDKTDVRESDQIGLTSFFYFTPANGVRLGDDESLWSNLRPGFFDVPKSIVNNQPINGEDGDFIYGSGYFPLRAKTTERFSIALVYGGGNGGSVQNDEADLLTNKKSVQKIYDANYLFPQPPTLPTLTAVTGDRAVTLYWDRVAETTIDPVLQTKTFEGYKIYKSTDPNFSDIFTITDGYGVPQGYEPLVQYDLNNGVKGFFQPSPVLMQDIKGYIYYLGSDTGLVHSYVDNDVKNGQRYFYAIVAYTRGDATLNILPAENRFGVTITSGGEVLHDRNVVVVTPNPKTIGYVAPTDVVPASHAAGPATGTVSYQVLDETAVTAHRYRVEFLDTQVDTIDNNSNGLKDASDSTEWDRRTSFYFVRDLDPRSETFVALDTLMVKLSRQNLIASTAQVTTAAGAVVNPTTYRLDAAHGTIRGASAGSLPAGTYTVTYQYYPVFRSPNIQGSPFLTDSKDADAFDGVSMVFNNAWTVDTDTSRGPTGWTEKKYYTWSINITNFLSYQDLREISGYRRPSDYRVEFSNTIVDTAVADDDYGTVATPVNFRVFNVTDSTYIKFVFNDMDGNGYVSPKDEILFKDKDPRGSPHYGWTLTFGTYASKDSTARPGAGDQFLVKMTKPFRNGDLFDFTTVKPHVDEQTAAQSVYRVRAVPNPYLTASTFEPPLNPGVTSGRGTRKIEFIHVPVGATIRIFTSRGDHVATLYQDGSIESGAVAWNLKTSENLDVAYGVYFYVVESPVGTTTGKLAIIK